jgi:hypothetical protein
VGTVWMGLKVWKWANGWCDELIAGSRMSGSIRYSAGKAMVSVGLAHSVLQADAYATSRCKLDGGTWFQECEAWLLTPHQLIRREFKKERIKAGY